MVRSWSVVSFAFHGSLVFAEPVGAGVALSCVKNLTHKPSVEMWRHSPTAARCQLVNLAGVGAPQSLRSPCGHFSKQVLRGSWFCGQGGT
jgi:hypothetical protein